MILEIAPGEKITIKIADSDGEFIIHYDDVNEKLSVHADMPDSKDREGEIYCEDWSNQPDCLVNIKLKYNDENPADFDVSEFIGSNPEIDAAISICEETIMASILRSIECQTRTWFEAGKYLAEKNISVDAFLQFCAQKSTTLTNLCATTIKSGFNSFENKE